MGLLIMSMNHPPRRTPGGAVAQRIEQAIALHRQGRLEDAEALYRQVLRRDPRQADALHFLGVLSAQRRRYAEAADLIRAALERQPRYADAHNNLGNVLAALGRWEAAASAYRRALALAPANASAHSNLGVMLRRAGRYSEALSAFEQALILDPRRADTSLHLGKTLAALERYEEALAAHHQAIRLQPGYAAAYRSLSLLLYRLERSAEAVALLQRWQAQDPANPVARHLLAAHSGAAVPLRAADDYVQDLFDGMAENFDAHLQRLQYRAPALLSEALAGVLGAADATRTVLDAGCGTGLCGPLLRPYARELVGVDLSPRMVDLARLRGDYDQLVVAELTAFLAADPARYDLVVSADTLVYFGDLDPVLTAAVTALRPGGSLAFTVEQGAVADKFHLARSGRYQHGEQYLRQGVQRAGLHLTLLDTVALRLEAGRDVVGWRVLARAAG